MDIKVIIAAHKKYPTPRDEMYIPLHVGAAGKRDIGFLRDDEGDNISNKNPRFCELTGLYYAWRNIDCDYLGLVHYRRHFKGKGGGAFPENVLTKNEAEQLLSRADIILPKKRNYVIENLYSHYVHTLIPEPLDIAGEIIRQKYPNYYDEFLRLKKRRSAHMFNMFIMKKEMCDKYCEWLFDILFELEKRSGDISCSGFQARFYGRVSELLLDVYINTNKLSSVECPVAFAEKEKWLKKGISFLRAKFFGKKYGKSF